MTDDGKIALLTKKDAGCNGYTDEQAQSARNLASQQYVTVSGQIAGMRAMLYNPVKEQAAIDDLANFALNIQFTGIEIDWENYDTWDQPLYNQ